MNMAAIKVLITRSHIVDEQGHMNVIKNVRIKVICATDSKSEIHPFFFFLLSFFSFSFQKLQETSSLV